VPHILSITINNIQHNGTYQIMSPELHYAVLSMLSVVTKPIILSVKILYVDIIIAVGVAIAAATAIATYSAVCSFSYSNIYSC
jgi:hypothetical protein